MGRRVGEFRNPNTGEIDWLEPETIEELGSILEPDTFYKTGQTYFNLIEYELKDCEKTKTINLCAYYTDTEDDTKYTSDCYKIDELEFAKCFADVTYQNLLLDSSPLIKKAKNHVKENLIEKLIDHNIIISNLQFSGLGFIKVNNDKLITMDKINYEHNDGRNPQITLKYCVGQTELNNILNPKIEFYTGKYKVSTDILSVEESTEGIIRTYYCNCNEIIIEKQKEKIEFKKFDLETLKDKEEIQDTFIESRSSLLTTDKEDDLEIDLDRFDF